MGKDDRVVDLVLERPGAALVFERLGIRYYAAGSATLDQACADAGLDVGAVLGALADAPRSPVGERDWRTASLAELCAHIIERHHEYLREEVPALRSLVERVTPSHVAAHPELVELRRTFLAVADEIERHMLAEERDLFPALVALEGGQRDESTEDLIRTLTDEHERIVDALSRLRALTNGYEAPLDAGNAYRAMLDRLATLEADAHLHAHKENNVLFPRAAALSIER